MNMDTWNAVLCIYFKVIGKIKVFVVGHLRWQMSKNIIVCDFLKSSISELIYAQNKMFYQ